MRTLTAVGVGALVVLCVLRRHDLAAAAGAVPPQVLVGCIVGCGLARVWLVLAVAHLDASPGAVALAFTALGAFGLLPLGPSAPPGALLVVSGGAAAGALAAGLALSATSLAGVLAYALVLAVTSRRSGPDGARARAARTRESG
jgi:hypothetical protein